MLGNVGVGLSPPELAVRCQPGPAGVLGPALLGFWDAERIDRLTLAGSAVAGWADSVGGHAAAQATAGARPEWQAAGFAGRPGIVFDGVDDYLDLASVPFPAGASPSEIWVLVRQDAATSGTGLRIAAAYGGASSNNRRAITRTVVSSVNRARTDCGNGSASIMATDAAVDLSGIHVMRGIFEAASVSVQVDGQAIGTPQAVAAATGTTRVRIGAATGSANNFWHGAINAVLVTGLLTNEQAAWLLRYLKARGGIG
jgi:hypothetical protein